MARLRKLSVDLLPGIQEPGGAQCCLYVLQEDGSDSFKIGVARHVLRRWSGLQGGNRRSLIPVLTYEGPRADCLRVERAALRYFHTSGSEWVYAERLGDIERFIDSLIEEVK